MAAAQLIRMSARRNGGFRLKKKKPEEDTSQCPLCQLLGILSTTGINGCVSQGFSLDGVSFVEYCSLHADNVVMTYLASITLSVKLSVGLSPKNV